MLKNKTNKALSQEERMKIFLALVESQDQKMTVLQSRTVVAEKFGVSEQQVKIIEQEGLDGEWPPL